MSFTKVNDYIIKFTITVNVLQHIFVLFYIQWFQYQGIHLGYPLS